jgi:hypothetical protein
MCLLGSRPLRTGVGFRQSKAASYEVKSSRPPLKPCKAVLKTFSNIESYAHPGLSQVVS